MWNVYKEQIHTEHLFTIHLIKFEFDIVTKLVIDFGDTSKRLWTLEKLAPIYFFVRVLNLKCVVETSEELNELSVPSILNNKLNLVASSFIYFPDYLEANVLLVLFETR